MVSSISRFREKLLRGGSRPNLFEVNVSFPNGITNTNFASNNGTVNTGAANAADLKEYTKFLAMSAQIPSMNLGVINMPYRGRVVKFPGDRTFEPFTITVHNDGANFLRSGFEAWSEGINGLSSNVGKICYPDYATDVIIKQLGRGCGTSVQNSDDLDVIRTYKLVNTWVQNVSSIDLNYEATDQISRFSVTFEYDYFVIEEVENSNATLGTNIPNGTPITQTGPR